MIFRISIYLLLRHLLAYYVFGQEERDLFRKFVIAYHQRWKAAKQTDNDILLFTTNRQQSTSETEARDRLLRSYLHDQPRPYSRPRHFGKLSAGSLD